MTVKIPIGDQAWIEKEIPSLLGGVDSSKRPDELGDTQCVRLENVLAKQGAVVNDTGYTPFIDQTLIGIPQLEFGWEQPDGSITFMLVTTKTLYQYNVTGPQWRIVKGTNSTTTNATVASGAFLFPVAATTGFVVGDTIGIDLPSGLQLISTVTAVNPGVSITIADMAPSTISSGAAVLRGVALNGNLDHQVVADAYAGNNWFVFTNGVDIVKYYDTTQCLDIPNLPSAGSIVCVAVCVYNASLFLLGTTEGGVDHPYRVRHSDEADPTNWTTGIAGYDDLLDKNDPIITAKRMGPYMYVYRDHSISQGQFLGSGGLNYNFVTMVDGEGSLSASSVIEIGPEREGQAAYHIVVGRSGIYQYYGDYTLRPFGEQIFFNVWGAGGDLNPQRRNRTWCQYSKELKEVWMGYASTFSDVPDTIWRYSTFYKIWYKRKFADTIISTNSYESIADLLWTDMVDVWTVQQRNWDELFSSGKATTIHLLNDGGAVFAYDYSSVLDNNTPITYTIETKDYFIKNANLRFDMLELYIQTLDTDVFYSTDGGAHWETLGNINQFPQDRVRMYAQFVGKRVRFRLTGSDTAFILEWINLTYKLESIYG